MSRAERLRSLGVLFTIFAVVINHFGYNSNDFSLFYASNKLSSILIGIFLFLIILLTIFWGSIDEFLKDRKNRNNKLSNTVISKKISIINILDAAGENATCFEKIIFHKIDLKNPYFSDVLADETNPSAYISNPQLANCTTNYVEKITRLEISFKDNIEQLNDIKSTYEVDKFLYFSIDLKNCFTNLKNESWKINVKNYCKEVEQKIVFPHGINIEQVKLYKIEDNKETVVTAITPIIIKEENKSEIYLYLTNLDKNECFEIRWTYSEI